MPIFSYRLANDKETVPRKLGQSPFFLNRVSLAEIQLLSKELAILLKAGLPLVTAIQVLLEHTTNRKLRDALFSIKNSLLGGSSLSHALAEFPSLFSSLYIASVKAGEVGDNLVEVLMRLHDHLKLVGDLKKKVRSALIYPAFLVFIAGAALTYLIIFVVPVFSKLYTDINSRLPLPTQVIISLSFIMRKAWGLIILVIIGAFIAWHKLKRKNKPKLLLDKLIIKLPVISELVKKYTIAQLTRTLATLLASGVALANALKIANEVVSNKVLSNAISPLHTNIQEGMSLAEALERTHVIPSLTIQMVHTGEQTGALEELLISASSVYEEEVLVKLTNIISALEPVLMLIMGIMVAAMLLAMYLPIFELSSRVSG